MEKKSVKFPEYELMITEMIDQSIKIKVISVENLMALDQEDSLFGNLSEVEQLI